MPEKEKTTKKDAKKKNTGLIIGVVIAILAVICVIALIWLAYRSNKGGDIAGKYELTAISSDGEDQTANLELLKSLGYEATLEMNEDGTCELDLFGEEVSCTYDGSNITTEEEASAYTFKDDAITFEEDGSSLTFTRQTEEDE